MSKSAPKRARISDDDLRATLQSFQDGITGKVASKKNTLLTVGGGALLLALLVFFMLGKRTGRKQTTLVEIRRI